MKIYKDKQFLIFDFEDGKSVKYDFATQTAIGKSGKPVKNICSQLRGLTINELCNNCQDVQYGKFLKFIYQCSDYYISNIGTILSKVPYFSRFEQIFSANLDDVVDKNFSYTINDIPKALIKLCKEKKIRLTDTFLKSYKKSPDAYLLAYSLKYYSLTDEDIYEILTNGTRAYEFNWKRESLIYVLLEEYGYTMKSLMLYIDHLKTYEAIEDMSYILNEIYDYARMMKKISVKFDKYPRRFLTTHKIACRNYQRLQQEFEEEKFQKRIDKGMEKTFGEYCFIYPDSTQEIKDEAVQQNNCVSSYIQNVIDGDCHILFLRKKDQPDKSLVTIEVQRGRIVQALQKFNDPLTKEQAEVVEKWNIWYKRKCESEEK